MSKHCIGVIAGSGLYHLEGFTNQKWLRVTTPFGPPSDALLTGKLAGRDVVYLPRHGRGHRLLPSELNHRANIWAMKKLGVAWIISVSAVGSLQRKYHPCDIVLVDLFLPFLQIGASAQSQYPPFQIEIAWLPIIQIYILFILLFVVALGALSALLVRMKIFQAIKLGETT